MTEALTREEFELLLRREEAALEEPARVLLKRYRLPAFTTVHEWNGSDGRNTSHLWVIAKAGPLVVAYDETEEEFGTGTLGHDGTVRNWGTYGERLQWALARFAATQQKD